jgi:hypothetical protein
VKPLPFAPEPLDKLKARFTEALTPDYHENAVGTQEIPGLLRKHVFDFENGIRMIVSHDVAHGHRALHFSFGLNPVAEAMAGDVFCNFAEQMILEFWHKAVVLDHVLTKKALHFWCKPDKKLIKN